MDKATEHFIKFMNDFWDEYDTDGNGSLDKDEFKQFLQDTYMEDDEQENSFDSGSNNENNNP